MAMVLRSPSSSSSSSSISGFSYDVFLSFRGKDTRKAFTDHLYTALKQAGIRTFRDDDGMDRGKLLKPELEKAIRQSQVSLIVFSESYATSKWCLDEVLMIMEKYDESCSPNKRREVVPVFYNIDPTDVRNQTGCFEDAFKGYDDEVTRETDVEKKMELSEKVEAWRSSLRKAGSLTGMVLSTDRYEAKFISNIVNIIRKKVNHNALYIKDRLVGRKKDVAEIESWLQDPSPNSTILLIDGMGGIGKTTIAKFVYNMNCREYDGCCFLANINEISNQSNGMLRLQSQILSTILKSEKEETIWNQDEGTIKVANAICNKKVLLVLDDVASLQQLDALLGPQTFYSGSKVIITTRHTWLLTSFKVPPKVKTIRRLSYDDSIELFSLYSFPQGQPIPYYYQSENVSQVIRYCKGLPLALEVLASNLRGKSIVEWKDAMCKLEKNPLPGIQKVLQLSYESLEDDNDKNVFLHIACFFVGEDVDFIVKLLVECKLYPIIGIKNLTDRSLLYVDHGKVIRMHQLIREMGKEVVRQESPEDPGKRSRLWQREDCINVLQENAGTKKVKGLMFDVQNVREAEKMDNPRKHSFIESNFKIGALEKMKNLMLLQLNYVTFSGKYKKQLRELRLLRWHGFSLKSIPGDIPLEKLVVLDMSYSKLKRVWNGYKFIESLKILNLSYSVELVKTPDFGGLPGLESLILKGCTLLTKVHESIADLEGLVLLDVSDCRSLTNLPCLPRSLVSLQMSGCPNLGAVGRFECSGSTSSPSLLVELNISDCNLFDTSFPNDWSNLVSLKWLTMDGNNVTYLPKCIQSLPILKRLYANRCSQIQSILGLPKTLTELEIKNNMSLEKVQVQSIQGFPKTLKNNITHLPGLVKRNISETHLFDKPFPPYDWSSVLGVPGKGLRMDGNNLNYLPKCIQSLPILEFHYAENSSRFQSIIQGLPKILGWNISMEKVEVPLESIVFVRSFKCPNLCNTEGWYKWTSIEKVERRVIEKLGLGMELGVDCYSNKQKVLLEYGIFSTRVTQKPIPSSFMYKERGPQISFIVPSHDHHENRRISGFNLSLVLSPVPYQWPHKLRIEVYNKTKDLLWIYFPGTFYDEEGKKKRGWLSVWRCGNLLHHGDQIFVSILDGLLYEEQVSREVEECCINLIYDDDNVEEEDQGKRKEVNDDDDEIIIRWSDRMLTDISDYVHSSITYSFGEFRRMDYDTGFESGAYWSRIYRERREQVAGQQQN